MAFDLPKPDDIFRYFEKHGEVRGNLTMKVLRKQQAFLDVLDSPVGAQILEDDIKRHEELLEKLYNEQCTPQELAEFRYLKRRIERVAAAIKAYSDNIKTIKGE